MINQLSSIGRDPNIINIINVLIIAATCIAVFLYVRVMKYLKNKKVINKAIINGINFFFATAIGINKMNNITIDIIDSVSIYIYLIHFILNLTCARYPIN